METNPSPVHITTQMNLHQNPAIFLFFVLLFLFFSSQEFCCMKTVFTSTLRRTRNRKIFFSCIIYDSDPRWCSVEAVVELRQWLPADAPVRGVVEQNALVTPDWHCVAAKHEVELNQHGGCQVQILSDQHPSAALKKASNKSAKNRKVEATSF